MKSDIAELDSLIGKPIIADMYGHTPNKTSGRVLTRYRIRGRDITGLAKVIDVRSTVKPHAKLKPWVAYLVSYEADERHNVTSLLVFYREEEPIFGDTDRYWLATIVAN